MASDSKPSSYMRKTEKKVLCCDEVEKIENNTCTEPNSKRSEITGMVFRKPDKIRNLKGETDTSKKSEGNQSEVKALSSAKTASSAQKLVSARTASSFSSHARRVNQHFENVTHLGKLPRVCKLSTMSDKPVVVCCNFKSDVEDMWMYLRQKGIAVCKLHGSVEQSTRDMALQDFKQHRVKVLVSTSKLMTGIVIPFVFHVINFDLPRDYSDYKRMLLKAKRTITLINDDSPRNSMLELSADEEILVPQFITEINDKCRSGIIRTRKPEKEVWMM